MTEKPKEETQETVIGPSARKALTPDEEKTVLAPAVTDEEKTKIHSDGDTDFLEDATMETMIQGGGADMLDDQTRETVIQDKALDGTQIDDEQTRETVMLRAPGEKEATQLAPSSLGGGDHHTEAKYEIVKSLGKGGFAWVYLVRNIDLDRLEAMKILNSELTEDEDVLNRFVKEAKISANFNHQNIVMVYEVQKRGRWTMFQADPEITRRHREPFAYFTMSFVEGNTATNMVRKQGRLPQKQAVRIVMDGCAALEYAHGKHVVHRDIKPENIMVDRKGNGIVMDFGIAKAADQTRKTAAGTFMGTARYVSPEQAMGKDIDGRSDIYSMGITLYELVTGTVPFSSDQWMTVLYQHINEQPPAPEKFYEGIDRDLRAIILKMLEKKPEDRYQTAGEVLNALQHVYSKLGGEERGTRNMDQIATRAAFAPQGTEVTEHVAPPPVRTHKRKAPETRPPKSKLPLFGGLAAAAVVVIAGFFLLKPDASPTPDPTPPPDNNGEQRPVPAAKKGKLMITAFPRGELAKIMDKAGNDVPFDGGGVLPKAIELPEGEYELVVIHNNVSKQVKAFVLANQAQVLAHAAFDIDAEAFLLEDLK
ncbi:MAG: serine/threonine-protein kinase [Acidobacteriota bacterium]|nr:serine/threonine-protein kinase [Acidobacteriota bacterium]